MDQVALKARIHDVVAAQGNAFIRELLREKGLPLSGTKGDFVSRLDAAVQEGALVATEVEEWLQRVEGWGNFHIYPLVVPPEVVGSRRWTEKELRRRLAEVAEDAWEAPTSHVFPVDLTLTHISFKDDILRMTWHQRGGTRRRVREHDEEKEVDGDLIELEAYLIRAMRRVVRFQVSLREGLAGMFVPYPLQDDQHVAALSGVWGTVSRVVTPDELPPFDVASIIRAADQAQLSGKGQLRSKSARLTISDGWLEVGSSAGPYGEIDALREVRLAAGQAEFAGERATFLYAPIGDTQSRDLSLTLSGRDRRAWLPGQLEESQVWTMISHLREFIT